MDYHTSFNQTLKDLCLRLAHFVITNNFLVCKGLDKICLPSEHLDSNGNVVLGDLWKFYAVIFMIRLETPIVNDARFRP